MVNFLRTSLIIVLISFTISVRCVDENEALHITRDFTRSTFDVVMMKKLGFPDLLYPTASACPAKTAEEDTFNTNNSFGKRSLFVRNIYEEGQSSHDVAYYICHQPYQMTVVYHPSTGDFKFGFEVYYEKSKFDANSFVDSNRGDYDSIENTGVYKNHIKFMYSKLPSVPVLSRIASIGAAVSKFMRNSLYLDAERKKELGFLWIESFHLKFDHTALRVAQATYKLSVTTRGRKQCDDYDLGEEFFNDLDMNELYLKDNQEEMLTNVVLPTSEIDGKPNEMACESGNKCFEKWSSVPPEILGHLAANPVSCSNLLTVPIWKSTIHDVLEKLDNFLYALSVVIGNPVGEITVNSGVHGVLYLPINNSYIWSKKSITLVENGIPVPNIIYKLIKYKTKICFLPKKRQNKNDDIETPKNEPFVGDQVIEPADTDENKNKIKLQNENDEMKNPENESTVGDTIDEPADTDKKELRGSENKLADSDEELKPLKTEHSGVDDKNDELKNQAPTDDDIKTAQMMKPKCEYATAAIIVVIHNDPHFNPEKEKICKEDVCKEAGWEMITIREFLGKEITSKYIYCCRANDKNAQKKLNIKYNFEEEEGLRSINVNFSLKAVPMFDIKTNNFEGRDVKDLVIKTYQHLFEGLEFEPIDHDEWDALMSTYHVKMQFLQIEAPTDDVEIEEPENDLKIEKPNNDGDESDNSESQSEDEEKNEKSTSKGEELGDKK